MGAIKDLHDLFTRLRDEVKDRRIHEALTEIREHIDRVIDENFRLKRDIETLERRITAIDRQELDSERKHAEEALSLRYENNELRIQLREAQGKANWACNIQSSTSETLPTSQPLIPPIENMGMSNQEIEEKIEPQPGKAISGQEILDSYQMLIIRRSLESIRIRIKDIGGKNITTDNAIMAISQVNVDVQIEPARILNDLIISRYLSNVYGDRLEITSEGFRFLGEIK